MFHNAAHDLHRLHPRYAKHAGRHGAHGARRAGQSVRHVLPDMPRDIDLLHNARPERIRRNGTVAKPHHEHAPAWADPFHQAVQFARKGTAHPPEQIGRAHGQFRRIKGDITPPALFKARGGIVRRECNAGDGNALLLLRFFRYARKRRMQLTRLHGKVCADGKRHKKPSLDQFEIQGIVCAPARGNICEKSPAQHVKCACNLGGHMV